MATITTKRCEECGRSLNKQRRVKVEVIGGMIIIMCKWCASAYSQK